MAYLLVVALLPLGWAGLFDHDPNIHQMSKMEMDDILANPQFLVVHTLYTEDGQNSIIFSQMLKTVASEYKNYLKFMVYNCQFDEENCPEDIIDSLPYIAIYTPTGLDQDTGKLVIGKQYFGGETSQELFKDFLRKKIPFMGDPVTNENLEEFLNFELNKVILFTDQKRPPLLYRGLSSSFTGHLEFGIVYQNQTEIIEKYGIQKYPTIAVIDQNNEMHKYEGKTDFEEIKQFLKPFASEEFHQVRPYSWLQSVSSKPKTNPLIDVQQTTLNNLQEKLLFDDRMAIVHFHKADAHKNWSQISNKYKGMALLIDITVSSDDESPYFTQKLLPTIKVFSQKRSKKPAVADTVEDIEMELRRELKYNFVTVDENSFSKFTNEMKFTNRVGCILLNDEAKLGYMVAAAYKPFNRHIVFAWQNHKHQGVMDYFGIKQYPAVICFINNANETIQGLIFEDGDINNYPGFHTFIVDRILGELKLAMPQRFDRQTDYDSIWLESYEEKNFYKNCIKKQTECIVALFPGTPNAPRFKPFLSLMKEVSLEVQLSGLPIKVGTVDGLCYSEVLDYLGVKKEDLPAFFVYDGTKQRIATYQGESNLDAYLHFIEDFDANTIGKQVDEAKLQPQARNCKEFYRQTLQQGTLEGKEAELYKQVLEELEEFGFDEDKGVSKSKKRRRRKASEDL